MSYKHVISVDLGGTKILSALINSKKEIVDRLKVPTDNSAGIEPISEAVVNSIETIIKKNSLKLKDIDVVSLGVPGTVNPYSGEIFDAPNLGGGIKNFNIKEAITRRIDIPVLIENDVNLAGLGIKNYELKDDVKNMLVIFIGTGIGSALFFEGLIYRGSSFFAGEIGHMKVAKKGLLGVSGKDSTFESLASRTAVVENIAKAVNKGEKSLLEKYVKSGKRIKSKALKNAVKKGDKVTVKYLSQSAMITGTVLGSITTLLNLDKIVLGGGVIEAMDDFMVPIIVDSFKKSVLPESGKIVDIVSTKLGDDAPLYGGLALAQEFLAS